MPNNTSIRSDVFLDVKPKDLLKQLTVFENND